MAIRSRSTPPVVLSLDPATADALGTSDRRAGPEIVVRTAEDDETVRDLLAAGSIDCAVCRHDPPTSDARAVVDALRGVAPNLPVVALTAPDRADEAIEAGVTDVVRIVDGSIPTRLLTNRIEALAERTEERRARDVLDAIAGASPEYAFVYDADGTYLDALIGGRSDEHAFEPEELLGRTIHETLDEAAAVPIQSAIDEALATGERATVEYRLEGPERERWYEGRAVPLPERFDGRDAVLLSAREVTDRRIRERELAETRDRLARILERVDDAFFALDENWEITYVNEAGADVLRRVMDADHDDEELIGRHLWEEAPEAVDTEFYEQYHRAMERQEPVSFESEYAPLDVWFEVRAYPDPDGLSVYFTDVTDRKADERRMEQYRTLTRAISDAIVTVDADGLIRSANPATEDVLGYDPDGLVGEPLTTIIPEGYVPAHEAGFERYLTTGDRTIDWDYIELPAEHADGHQVPLAISFSEYEHAGDRFFTAVLRDITDRRERERTLNDLLDATQAFHRADGVDALLEELIEAAESVFGFEVVSVRLHDEEAGQLPPTAVSETARELVPRQPTYDDDEWLIGEAFQRGEPVVADDLGAESDHDYGPFGGGMALPLGEHGVVSIAVEERDAFDDEDVALVELLALSATGALDRLARERERRQFRRVVDQIDEMAFLMDADHRLTFVTESLAAYLGRDVETLRGSRLYDVVADEHVADCRARLTATRESAGTATQQIDLVGGDGESRPVEIELSAADEGMGREGGADQPAMAGVVTDISELEQTRDRLATERRRFRELFENLPDPVVEAELTDEGPIVRYANPAFTDVFGHGGAIQGADLDDLVVPAEERDRAERIDERVRDGEQVSVEVRRETRDGRRDFLLRGIPYSRTAHGDGSYAFAVYTDITEQKERERFRQVLNRVLRHNLRNDLTVVMGLADHLRGSVSDPALAERAGTLRDNAAEVASTSEKVRTIERITGRRAESDGTERVDAAGQLRAAVAGARRDHPEADITVDVPDELPVRGTGDLQRAFAELVENAVEHADGTPRLRIDAATGVGHDDRTELRFHDHGPGIPDREWEIVAGEREITQLTHGTGLGLWLIRWIVEFCGGEIERRRREDGTTVVLSLRSADVDPDGDD